MNGLLAATLCIGAKISGLTSWDHVGLVVECTDQQHEYFGQLMFLEANISGITCRLLKDRIHKTSSKKIAIRKLYNNKNDKLSLTQFKQFLWQQTQKYITCNYNKSFSNYVGAWWHSGIKSASKPCFVVCCLLTVKNN